MSAFKPRNVAIIGGTICAGIAAVNYGGFTFKTPGIQNIENRHIAGGGGANHVPAGGTPTGSQDTTEGRQEKQKGPGTKFHAENIDAQKPEPSGLGKKWNQTMHGKDKGNH